MSPHFKTYSSFYILIFIVIVQLIFSAKFIYMYHTLDQTIDSRIAAAEKLEQTIQSMKCDSSDKDIFSKLLKFAIDDIKITMEFFLGSGVFLFITAVSSSIAIFYLRKKYVANKPV